HQARHLGVLAMALGNDLIATDAGANFAAGREMGPGQEVAGLAAMDAADERLRVEQPLEEQHLLAIGPQRFEDAAQLHLLAFAARPPLAAVEAVAREEAREAHRRLRGPLLAERGQRFEPGKRYADAEAAQEG